MLDADTVAGSPSSVWRVRSQAKYRRRMCTLGDILENDIIRPMHQEWLIKGELRVVQRLIELRFGRLRVWAEYSLSEMDAPELEELSAQVFYSESLEGLLEGPTFHEIMNSQNRQWDFRRGQLSILKRQMEARFGELPKWAEKRLADKTLFQLEPLSEWVFDAKSLKTLLR